MPFRPFSRFVGSTVTACVFAFAPAAMADDPPIAVSAQPSLAQLSFIGLPADRLLAAGLAPIGPAAEFVMLAATLEACTAPNDEVAVTGLLKNLLAGLPPDDDELHLLKPLIQ